MYRIIFTKKFDQELKKLTKHNKTLKIRIIKTIKILSDNINQKSLRLHKLDGLDNWSISVNKSIRIIINVENEKIYLLQIGTHDEVY